jgi:hypothetical protein
MGIMANTNLNNQRQVFVEEYVRSGDHLEAAKKAVYKDTLHYVIKPVSSAESVQMK